MTCGRCGSYFNREAIRVRQADTPSRQQDVDNSIDGGGNGFLELIIVAILITSILILAVMLAAMLIARWVERWP